VLIIPAVLALAGLQPGLGQTVSLSLAPGTGLVGGTAYVLITLNTASPSAGLQWTLKYSTVDFTAITVSPGSAALGVGKRVFCNASAAGVLTCLIEGLNAARIPNGVVAVAAFTISATTPHTSSAVQLSNPMAVSPVGSPVLAAGSSITVTILQKPKAVSVAPSSGSGLSGTFRFLASAPNGAAYLTLNLMLVNSGLKLANACLVAYTPNPPAFYLYNDAGTALLGPAAPGTPASLQNSQCTVNAAASGALTAGTNLLINVALTFNPAFGGAKGIYMFPGPAQLGGAWQVLGTWNVR